MSFQLSEKAILEVNGPLVTNGSKALGFFSEFMAMVEVEDGSSKQYSFVFESNFSTIDATVETLPIK